MFLFSYTTQNEPSLMASIKVCLQDDELKGPLTHRITLINIRIKGLKWIINHQTTFGAYHVHRLITLETFVIAVNHMVGQDGRSLHVVIKGSQFCRINPFIYLLLKTHC